MIQFEYLCKPKELYRQNPSSCLMGEILSLCKYVYSTNQTQPNT